MDDTGIKLREKSFALALRIVKLGRFLEQQKHEYVLSRQILRSGTSIGANVRESRFAQSDADFISKLHIALKEAEETEYWLELLHASDLLDDKQFESLFADTDYLLGMLVNIVKSIKQKVSTRTTKT